MTCVTYAPGKNAALDSALFKQFRGAGDMSMSEVPGPGGELPAAARKRQSGFLAVITSPGKAGSTYGLFASPSTPSSEPALAPLFVNAHISLSPLATYIFVHSTPGRGAPVGPLHTAGVTPLTA